MPILLYVLRRMNAWILSYTSVDTPDTVIFASYWSNTRTCLGLAGTLHATLRQITAIRRWYGDTEAEGIAFPDAVAEVAVVAPPTISVVFTRIFVWIQRLAAATRQTT